PAVIVAVVLVGAFLAPARGLFGNSVAACVGYGYGYGYGYAGNTAPTVTGVVPTSGTTTGGNTVFVNGTGFCNGITSVKFGSSSTSFTGLARAVISAIAPAHAAASVDVTAPNPAGTSATSAADQYT